MQERKRALIAGCPVDLMNMGETVNKIAEFINNRNPIQVITLNPEMVFAAQKDDTFKNIINQADLITADGISIVWALRQFGYQLKERVTGIDLLNSLCAKGGPEHWRIFLLGSAPGIAQKAGEVLSNNNPGLIVCGTNDGYFSQHEEEEVVQLIKNSSPDILFVGMGSPRQEYWINKYLNKLQVPVSIGVGGSFDVIAGIKNRAPQWVISLNIEWLYRLMCEPARIKRQIALPKFVALVYKEKRKKARINQYWEERE